MDGELTSLKVLHNMKAARQKGVETIINPAPAIPLPAEAYEGLGHLIVNETEAAILSGIENPTSWDEVAAVFISRGVQNVIITLGGEVRSRTPNVVILILMRMIGCFLPDSQATSRVQERQHRPSTQSQGCRHNSCWRHLRRRVHRCCGSLEGNRPRC
jgi:hypothetical protein